MKTLLDHFPQASEQNIVRSLVENHQDCLATFLMPRPHHNGKESAVGTGFFVSSRDRGIVRLITARHVFDEFKREVGSITVGTRAIKTGAVGLLKMYSNVDLAIWDIPSGVFFEFGIGEIGTMPLFDGITAREFFDPTSSFVIMGYPGSKNSEIDYRPGRSAERKIMGLALHEPWYSPEAGVRRFPYSGKTLPEAWSAEQIAAPSLKGVSGAPCMRVVIHKLSGKLSLICVGVFYDMNKRSGEISIVVIADPWESD